jgi:hypothetical protein
VDHARRGLRHYQPMMDATRSTTSVRVDKAADVADCVSRESIRGMRPEAVD